MKYYKEEFLKSELFYKEFFISDSSLFYYAIIEGRKKKVRSYEEALAVAQTQYKLHCKKYFEEDILFYHELSNYILNQEGQIKEAEEYTFFKICYYAIKYLELMYEYKFFFGEGHIELADKENSIEFVYYNHMTSILFRHGNRVKSYEIHEKRKLQLYDKRLWDSMQFYDCFYISGTSLSDYINRRKEADNYKISEEEIHNDLNEAYVYSCENAYKPGILFYDELTEIIVNGDGTFEPMNEALFVKLYYYRIKCAVILNENRNYFMEERKKFKENLYDKSFMELLNAYLHDAHAVLEYKDKVLRIHYSPGKFEKIFDFYGVDEWQEQEFMRSDPILMVGELYEQLPGIFVYHTLWWHKPIDGEYHSDLIIKFKRVIRVK